jgi:sugar phosphate isomerase/epimerase
MYNRREIGTITLAGLAAPLVGLAAPFAGLFGQRGTDVHLGVNTSSFRNLANGSGRDPIEPLIQALVACNVRECELSAAQVEPRFGGAHAGPHTKSARSPQMMRSELRKWRLRTPAAYFTAIATRFQKAGIAIHAYNFSPNRSFSDEEINQGFISAKALGAQLITAATTADVAQRLAPFAERHRMIVALCDDASNANGRTTSKPLAAAMSLSHYFKVNLDIGHCTAANLDALVYLREHHAAVRTVRLKDRRRNGESVQWGEGDAPIREVLQLLKREAWPIRVYVEYDYAGGASPVDEVKKCLAYATESLA